MGSHCFAGSFLRLGLGGEGRGGKWDKEGREVYQGMEYLGADFVRPGVYFFPFTVVARGEGGVGWLGGFGEQGSKVLSV